MSPQPPRNRLLFAGAIAIAILAVLPTAMAADQPPKAPKNVTCVPQEDGVHVSWSSVDGATSYNVWRKVGNNGEWIQIATTTSTSYTDSTAAPGQRYHYAVSSVNEAGESDRSGTCNVTSIPFFPSMLVAGAALVASVGAVALIRRRS